MKLVDKIILCFFSIIILLLAIVSCFFIFGWADITTLYVMVSSALADNIICNVLIGVNVVLILLAIKGIFFESSTKKDGMLEDGVLLENEDGKLLITKSTLTRIVDTVVSGFESVKNSQTSVRLNQNNELSIVLVIEVSNNAVIKELSNNIQMRVKESIKKSIDLDVKNIDIKVKNVVVPGETKEI